MLSAESATGILTTEQMRAKRKRDNGKRGSKAKLCLLTEQETDLLYDNCNTYEEILTNKGLINTGMRISEYIHMDKSWLHWQSTGKSKGYIIIPLEKPCDCASCKHNSDHPGIWRTKTPESARRIPIVPEIEGVFRKHFDAYDAIMNSLPNRQYAWNQVVTVSDRAGIQHKVFPHALRGTFASILAGKDFDAFSIKQIMGWKSIKTADEYIQISPHRLNKQFEDKW